MNLLGKGIILIMVLFYSAASAQDPAGSYFRDEASDVVSGFSRYHWPDKSRVISIDIQQVSTMLRHCPQEVFPTPSGFGQAIEIPVPDGGSRIFRIFQVPVMDPLLAAKFPAFRTYAGSATDESGATIRISLTDLGFQAMIRDGENSVFIDPVTTFPNSGYYLVYYRKDLSAYRTFECETSSKNGNVISSSGNMQVQRTTGTQLRTYRLALACTGEYAAYYGGTVSGAMSGIVASMNRVNGIYETDVAVRMTLIANNNLIVYTNASTDPYTNNSGSTMLSQNQSNLTSVIGSSNYDIGHVFSTGGGGVATLNSPCSSTNKARGVTGSGSPVGDAFDVDYVAHEMGHQFGGQHTFNGTTGNCGGGNRTSSAAYEPGSGITIMAYAGICGAEDLAPHSIAYFHTYSYEQIAIFTITGSGNTCAAITSTGNTPPVVNLGTPLTYTIPYLTPFRLTGTATDANGDALTYSWEQVDRGVQSPPVSPDGPIFRSFDPVSSGTRVFPKLSDILGNTSTYGEWLPTAARNLKFKLTVRDNRANGGGVSNGTDTMRITVVNTGAGFSVTSPNTAVSWMAGSSQTVTWNVSQTNISPISCANVKISLSTDGGQTFPHVLLATTPNDGSQTVTVPSVSATSLARIKVEAVGNIFFDISNANFTIQPSVTATLNLRIFLQGIYNTGQSMDAVLGGTNADSVTVELHNSTAPYALVQTVKTVINTGGYGTLTFPGTVIGNSYYIVIRHRNSLQTWSKFPVMFSSNTTFNFTL